MKQLEQALKAKNKEAAMKLFDWQGVSKEMKARQEGMFALLFEQDVKSVKRSSLPSNFPLEPEENGVRYRPNVSVVGIITVEYADEDNPMEAGFAYGIKDKAFYLATLIEGKPPNLNGH